MKTKLPNQIKTVKEAKAFLTELIINDESYHPEDNANDVFLGTIKNERGILTKAECDQLNKLMDDIYDLPNGFDPCRFILNYLVLQTEQLNDLYERQEGN